jgi:hypothetical protein
MTTNIAFPSAIAHGDTSTTVPALWKADYSRTTVARTETGGRDTEALMSSLAGLIKVLFPTSQTLASTEPSYPEAATGRIMELIRIVLECLAAVRSIRTEVSSSQPAVASSNNVATPQEVLTADGYRAHFELARQYLEANAGSEDEALLAADLATRLAQGQGRAYPAGGGDARAVLARLRQRREQTSGN